MTDVNNPELSQDIIENRRFLQISGIVAMIAGALAIVLPHLATIAANIVIGALLAAWGIVALLHARRSSTNDYIATSMFAAILAIIGGIAMLVFPLSGIFALTTILVFYFLIGGVARVYLGWKQRNADGWGWIIAGGVVSAVLAVIVVAGLPGTAFWALGLILGIDLIFYGAGLTAISFRARHHGAAAGPV